MDVANLKVPDLKRELKNLGYPTTGTKIELIARLQQAMSADKPQSDDSVLEDELLDDEDMLEDEDDDDLDTDVLESTVGGSVSREVTSTTNISTTSGSSPTKLSSIGAASGGGSGGVVISSSTSSAVSTSPTKKVLASSNLNGANNEVDDPSSPKKKKLTINRQPVEPTTTTSTQPTTTEKRNSTSPSKTSISPPKSAIEIKKQEDSIKILTAEERAKLRQQKFGPGGTPIPSTPGTPLAADEKKQKRAEKFSHTPDLTSAAGVKISLTTEESVRLAKRKERFGVVDTSPAPTITKNANTSTIINKGGATIKGPSAVGTPTPAAAKTGLDEAKLKRAARFLIGSNPEVDEKKKSRAERFTT